MIPCIQIWENTHLRDLCFNITKCKCIKICLWMINTKSKRVVTFKEKWERTWLEECIQGALNGRYVDKKEKLKQYSHILRLDQDGQGLHGVLLHFYFIYDIFYRCYNNVIFLTHVKISLELEELVLSQS